MIVAVAAIALATTPLTSEATIQSSLLSYAVKQIGKTIGSGQCAELAAEALDAVNAKPYGTWQDSPSVGDYVWGRQIAEITPGKTNLDLQPGDILQFRNVSIKTKSGNATFTYTAQQHTAIIETFDSQTGQAQVLQQNSRGRNYVTRDSLSLADMKGGTIWAYRPQPRK